MRPFQGLLLLLIVVILHGKSRRRHMASRGAPTWQVESHPPHPPLFEAQLRSHSLNKKSSNYRKSCIRTLLCTRYQINQYYQTFSKVTNLTLLKILPKIPHMPVPPTDSTPSKLVVAGGVPLTRQTLDFPQVHIFLFFSQLRSNDIRNGG